MQIVPCLTYATSSCLDQNFFDPILTVQSNVRPREQREGRVPALLPRLTESLKRKAMIRFFDMDDRARLRERFYGAIHTVLARL